MENRSGLNRVWIKPSSTMILDTGYLTVIKSLKLKTKLSNRDLRSKYLNAWPSG